MNSLLDTVLAKLFPVKQLALAPEDLGTTLCYQQRMRRKEHWSLRVQDLALARHRENV